MFSVFILFFIGLLFWGSMGHLSRAIQVERVLVAFYIFVWFVGLCYMLCIGFASFGLFLLVLAAPFLLHAVARALKAFILWALKGL